MSEPVTGGGETGRYLHYLPPVLWQAQGPSLEFSVGQMLRVFEKILSGIEDGETLTHRPHAARLEHEHEGIEAEIDRLYQLFDPRTVRDAFLPWLAGWVGLRLPPVWDDYQQRKAIAEIAQIHLQRGLREGLRQNLDLYAVATTRPRIVVDDAAKVLASRLIPEQAAAVYALVSQGPFVREDRTVAHSGLVRPRSIALTPDGDLLVGDEGMPGDTPPVRPGVWRITRTGDYADAAGVPPSPRPLGQPNWNLRSALALAVDDRSVPWRAYVLDFAGQRLYRLTAPALDQAVAVATVAQLGITVPEGMAFDANGHLLILDRGPGIVDVDLALAPPTATRRVLTEVLQPRALLVASDGTLVIGDAREADAPTPADLVVVDRTDPANWVERRLLAALPRDRNPLVAPFAVVEEDPGHLLVLDIGLKPDADASEPFLRTIAEPAAVYRVALGLQPPAVTRATEAGRLVYPTDMVRHDGILYICDFGEPELATQRRRQWRVAPHEFGVIVHFSKERPPRSAEQQKAIIRDITEIVVSQKPAGSFASVITAIGTGS